MINSMRKNEIIHEKLLWWSKDNLRDFPWRKTSDPYKIFIAEIMLHRTRASQVEGIYKNFIKKYSDFKSICDACPEKIIDELSGLGLQWRVQLLYQLSCDIEREYNGLIPVDKNELLKLPGIGPYITAAFLCFAYDIPKPLLDTNIVRVIGRIFGLKITDSSRRSKKFENIMRDIIKSGNCKQVSLALIDFAEAICKPKVPLCNICFLNNLCYYYKHFIG